MGLYGRLRSAFDVLIGWGAVSVPKLRKEDISEAQKMKRAGCLNKDIAAYIGVAEETFSRWVNHPKTENQRQLAQALKKTEADRKRDLLEKIYDAAARKGNPSWQAAAWLLERQYPEEFAQRSKVQADAKVEAAPVFVFEPEKDG